MKKGLVLMATLVGLGGSAGAGYYAMQQGVFAQDGGGSDTHAQSQDSEAKFVEIEPLVLPLVKDGHIQNHVFVSVSLKVAGKGDVSPVLAKKFRLHHAFLMALYDQSIRNPRDPKGVDREKIKSVVKSEANRLLEKDLVQAVRIREAVHGKG